MALPALLSGLGRKLLVEGAKGVAKDAFFGKKSGGGNGGKPPEDENKSHSSSSSGKLAIRPSSSIVQLSPSNIGGQFGNNLKGGGNNLLTIKEKVARIENILGESYKFKKKQAEKERTLSERNKRKEKEELLEKNPKEKENKGKNKIPIPGKGIFDNLVSRVFNFLFWVTIGKALPTIQKLLPGIIGFLDVLFKIMDVIISVVGTILDSIITFVDWGFRAWDQIRNAVKAIGGDGLVDALDKFTGVVDTLLNLLFIASMASMVDSVKDTVKGVARGARGVARAFRRGAGKALKRTGILLGGKLGGKVAKGIGNLAGGAVRAVGKIGTAIGLGGVAKGVGDFIGGVGKNIGKGIDTAKDFVGKKKDDFIEWLLGKWKGLKDGAIDLGKKAVNKAKGWGDNILKGAIELKDKGQKAVVDNILGPLKSQADDIISKSPALQKVMSLFKGAGKQGVGDAATSAFKQFVSFVDPILKPIGKTLKNLNLPVIDSVIEGLFALYDLSSGVPPVRVALRLGGSLAGLSLGLFLTGASTFFSGGFGAFLAPILIGASQWGGEWLGDRVADMMGIPLNNNTPKDDSKPKQKDQSQNSKQEVPAKRFGGIVPLAFEDGGILSINSQENIPQEKIPQEKIIQEKIPQEKTDYSRKIKSTRVKTTLPDITAIAKNNKNIADIYSGVGAKKLIDLGNEFKDIPIIGSAMYAAINVALGNKVDTPTVDTIANDLIYFSSMDSFGKISSLSELNTMQNGGIVEKDFGTIQSDMENSQLTLSKFLYNKINQERVGKITEKEKEESESGNAWWDPLGLFKSKEKKRAQEDSDSPGPDGSTPSNVGGGSFEANLAKLLKSYEGLKTKAYKDAVGIPTIGMGATYYPKGFRLSGKVKMSDTITEEEALWIKQQHIKEHRQRLLREVPLATYSKVPDNVKAALESKVFNYGSLGGPLTDLVKSAATSGNYSSVSSYFRNTLAKHDRGLNSWRRNDEAGVIDTGVSKRAGVSFPKQSGVEAQKSYETPPPGGKAKDSGSASPVVGGDGKFIQGNSGASAGVHFHIGPGSQVKGSILQKQYYADARQTAKATIDHFLKKGSRIYDGRRGVYYKSSDEVDAAQKAHTASGSAGGIDLQVDFEKPHPFPLKTTGMKYRPNGFGVSADIVGSNSFVAHGRYDEKGKVAPQERMKIYQGGGLISPMKNQTIPDSFASYEQPGSNTKIIMVPFPVQSQSSSMSPMVSKSLQSIPEVRSLNSMGGRMDQIHQLSRY